LQWQIPLTIDTLSVLPRCTRHTMTIVAAREKIPQAIFALFGWHSDLASEVTAAEAEAFFQFIEAAETHGLEKTVADDLQSSYPKLWREYARTGPLRPEQLNQLLYHIDDKSRRATVALLSALQAAAPRKNVVPRYCCMNHYNGSRGVKMQPLQTCRQSMRGAAFTPKLPL